MCAVGLLYSAQQKPPPQPVFKSEVTAVEVDVVATRKSGELVRGLRQEDFEVLEDMAIAKSIAGRAVEQSQPGDLAGDHRSPFSAHPHDTWPSLLRRYALPLTYRAMSAAVANHTPGFDFI
jgi:hypothetical protein